MLRSIDEVTKPAADASSKQAAAGTCDPVTLEILRGAIRAVQAEMEALIERTAISAFIREKKDFYTSLFDADGVMAVGSNMPVFGDMSGSVFKRFPPETMRPGDLYWYSDCYESTGAVSHSNDQVLIAPVFHQGRRCAFVMSWAHFADIGGMRAGSISPDATDIFQEGIIVPATKLIEAGRVNEAVLELFHRNSRFPEQSRGDMRALMASVELGVKRVEEILIRFGAPVVEDGLRQLLTRTRRLVRERLAETFPYGTHRFTDAIDSDGHGNGPYRIRFALTRERGGKGEDRFVFDASETDDQSPGPVNFLMNPGVPGMALGLYYLGGDPGQVCNAGGPQALDEVILRQGSLLAPRFPAPLGMRGLTMMRVLAGLMGLVNVAGGKAPAAHSAYVITLMRGTFTDEKNEKQPFLLSDGIGVGYGEPLCGRHRCRLFRRPGKLSGRVRRARLSGAPHPLRHRERQRRARPSPRRLRHRARIRNPRRRGRPRGAHRRRLEPALGHCGRHVGRCRACRHQSGHGASCGRSPTAIGSHAATSCAS
jgi:N-methylhydantoinase B